MASKLQHYVPQFYLEAFADPKHPTNIWVYEKGQAVPRSQGIKGTAAETHYYSLKSPSGQRNDLLETEVLARIESEAAPVLRRLRTEKKPVVTERDMVAVGPFIAALFVRSPRMRQDTEEIMANIARKLALEAAMDDRAAEEFLKASPELGLSKKELRELANALQDPGRFRIEVHENVLKGQPFLMMKDLAPYIYGRKWSLLQAPTGSEFITSDSPLSVFELSQVGTALIGVGIGRPRAELTLPIAPHLALKMTLWERKPRRRISKVAVREINRRIACQAHRFVYACRRSRPVEALVQEFSVTRGMPRVDPEEIRRHVRRLLQAQRRQQREELS